MGEVFSKPEMQEIVREAQFPVVFLQAYCTLRRRDLNTVEEAIQDLGRRGLRIIPFLGKHAKGLFHFSESGGDRAYLLLRTMARVALREMYQAPEDSTNVTLGLKYLEERMREESRRISEQFEFLPKKDIPLASPAAYWHSTSRH